MYICRPGIDMRQNKVLGLVEQLLFPGTALEQLLFLGTASQDGSSRKTSIPLRLQLPPVCQEAVDRTVLKKNQTLKQLIFYE